MLKARPALIFVIFFVGRVRWPNIVQRHLNVRIFRLSWNCMHNAFCSAPRAVGFHNAVSRSTRLRLSDRHGDALLQHSIKRVCSRRCSTWHTLWSWSSCQPHLFRLSLLELFKRLHLRSVEFGFALMRYLITICYRRWTSCRPCVLFSSGYTACSTVCTLAHYIFYF